ncbi:sulfite exporter TauE/SafE family protein [Pseudonocardia halophobica]|uniref:sulfite exporter TauE/SafE family protein n=1 Tax=Pseudonocardia halophobica TaxID=29401 RepID=UPI003D8D9072
MVVLWAGLVVAAGAVIQGTVGFGLALVAAPLLALLDPQYVPVPLIVVAGVHAVFQLVREWRDADWRGVGWALAGRVPGAVLGATVVALLPYRAFASFVAVAVLLCVAASLVRLHLRPTRPALLVAGAVSGVSGTAAAIGGPPVAILYQDEHGATVRATLGAYFGVGTAMSLGVLAAGGQVDVSHLLQGAVLVPFAAAGLLLSNPLRRILDRGWTRPAVLGLAAAGAVTLLVQAQFT